jgi:aminoglycoside 6'-N-acetyltransferase I
MTHSDVTIATMGLDDEARITRVCELLVPSFRDLAPTWVPTLDAARARVIEALQPGMFSRVLLVGDSVVGWVGARHNYGSVWELHPLVVDEVMRGRGYGRALVEDIEGMVGGEGALTLLVGTSDEVSRTTLADQDLFHDPLGALRELRTMGTHPLGFWQKIGYTVIGVVPDAEGPGKPTILLAKRVGVGFWRNSTSVSPRSSGSEETTGRVVDSEKCTRPKTAWSPTGD